MTEIGQISIFDQRRSNLHSNNSNYFVREICRQKLNLTDYKFDCQRSNLAKFDCQRSNLTKFQSLLLLDILNHIYMKLLIRVWFVILLAWFLGDCLWYIKSFQQHYCVYSGTRPQMDPLPERHFVVWVDQRVLDIFLEETFVICFNWLSLFYLQVLQVWDAGRF